MIDVDEESTNSFNRVIISMLEEIIEQNQMNNYNINNIISFNFDEMFEDFTISNIMSISMEEESDRALSKSDDVELRFDDVKYQKNDGECDEMCCVCLTELQNNEYIYICKHCKIKTHYDCMNEWVKRKIECPQCRTSLLHSVDIKDDFVKFIEEELDI